MKSSNAFFVFRISIASPGESRRLRDVGLRLRAEEFIESRRQYWGLMTSM